VVGFPVTRYKPLNLELFAAVSKPFVLQGVSTWIQRMPGFGVLARSNIARMEVGMRVAGKAVWPPLYEDLARPGGE